MNVCFGEVIVIGVVLFSNGFVQKVYKLFFAM